MAVQITGRQIANAAVGVAKLSLSTGTFDFSSGDAIVSVNTPSADSHAATKGYVDGIAQGLNWKESVRAATTADITLSGTQTIDGVAVVADDRVLVKDQTDQTENGIYVAASGSWARADDMDAAGEFSGAAIFIQEGTANADTGYVCTNNGDVTIGTDNIAFTQFTGAGQLSAGNGIDITNSTISVDLDGSTLANGANGLSIAANGVGTTEIADSSVTNDKLAGSIANAKLANSTISGVALGSNLNALSASASGAITMTSYNGSAAISDIAVNLAASGGLEIATNALQVKLDGSTLALGANGVSVADAGIDTTQIANSAVTAAKLAGSIPADKLNLGNGLNNNAGNLQLDLDGSTLALGANGVSVANNGIGNAQIADASIKTEKLDIVGIFSAFDADGSTLAFELQGAVDLDLAQGFVVAVNGLLMEYKSTPDSADNYKFDNNGVGDVGRVVFGANLSNGDRVTVRAYVNDPA
jgi:hypothetical protein